MPLKCQCVALACSGDTMPQSVCGDLAVVTQQPLLIIPCHVTADLNHSVLGAYQVDGGGGRRRTVADLEAVLEAAGGRSYVLLPEHFFVLLGRPGVVTRCHGISI